MFRLKPQVLLFLTMLVGWMNRKQQLVIDYLLEENKVLREQLDIHAGGKRLRYTTKQRRVYPRLAGTLGACS